MRSAASNGGVGATRSSTRFEREREREALKEENATPNSTEGGGVRDSVVAGYNHGDSATKRKGIQPQIFLVEKRDIFFNLVYLKRRRERRKNEEKFFFDKY